MISTLTPSTGRTAGLAYWRQRSCRRSMKRYLPAFFSSAIVSPVMAGTTFFPSILCWARKYLKMVLRVSPFQPDGSCSSGMRKGTPIEGSGYRVWYNAKPTNTLEQTTTTTKVFPPYQTVHQPFNHSTIQSRNALPLPYLGCRFGTPRLLLHCSRPQQFCEDRHSWPSCRRAGDFDLAKWGGDDPVCRWGV